MSCCDIFEVFDEKNNLIKEYAHWKLLISNRIKTLGQCVIITNRHMLRLSEISDEEMAEFAQVVRELEHALKQAFNYDKINYQMLMMGDPHTHFHVIPRYSETKHFAGVEWVDEGWPQLPGGPRPALPQEVLNQVKEEIKNHIN